MGRGKNSGKIMDRNIISRGPVWQSSPVCLEMLRIKESIRRATGSRERLDLEDPWSRT